MKMLTLVFIIALAISSIVHGDEVEYQLEDTFIHLNAKLCFWYPELKTFRCCYGFKDHKTDLCVEFFDKFEDTYKKIMDIRFKQDGKVLKEEERTYRWDWNIKTNILGLPKWEPIDDADYQFYQSCAEGYTFPFRQLCIIVDEHKNEIHDPNRKRSKNWWQTLTVVMRLDSSDINLNGLQITFRPFKI